MKSKAIKIGTRRSELALWQANHLKTKIEALGFEVELVLYETMGDVNRETSLHNFGQTGIFTKALDLALEKKEIDLAVHSLKDYPTIPHHKIVIKSVGQRENASDVLVKSSVSKHVNNNNWQIGSGSIRRKAQWKYKYPNSEFFELRGNVPTRLEKLAYSKWDGIIMAYAGMQRLGLMSDQMVELSWMIPAPAQGALGASFRKYDSFIEELTNNLQDPEVQLCVSTERLFLNKLEGGCSAPIGAHAQIRGNQLIFRACLHDPEGKKALFLKKVIDKNAAQEHVSDWVQEIIENGGREIMERIKTL